VKLQRVLLLAGIFPPDIGGPAVFADVLVRELPARNISPALLRFSRYRRYPRGVRHALFLGRILSERSPFQVLFALDPVSVGLPALIASKLLRRPFVLRIGGDFAWEQATERFGFEAGLDPFLEERGVVWTRMLVWLERWVARRAKLVITPNQYLRHVLLRWGVIEERIMVIPNGVKPAEPASTREQVRSKLGLEQGQVIVSIGRLMRYKGFNELVEAVAELMGTLPRLTLIIIGSGPQQDKIASRIQELGLAGRIHLLGSLPHDETLQYLQAADLFVLNSATEGQSHAILEAMAAGTPVLTTRAGGNPELIEHGRNGWLVDHNDREALVEAMSVLLQDERQAKAFAAAARETVDDFRIDTMVDQVIAALEEAL
jgi:glycosyltransferase involved in cell wall biosynthesis